MMRNKGGKMRKSEQIAFCVVMICIGLMLTGVMLFYAHKSDKLLRDYQNNNLTLNVEKTGWTLGYDDDGHIVYRQKNTECRVK
jgi:amino acid permease